MVGEMERKQGKESKEDRRKMDGWVEPRVYFTEPLLLHFLSVTTRH